ncbi:MAG: potassium transporter [Gemmatimonadetes bacterium]|nr:potassium transporter [Gemmatimonadota bacterium]MBT6146711.1 potassium transporter [Gemmatimonadota bacterium]MBT7859096.1 potassium transporter [Gemmatimonadota bacterium]
MHGDSFLFQAFIYLAAAVLSVPIAKRLGLGSVLGYLGAGVIIGPFALGLINDVEAVMHFAEFGVVMMLFLIGLELRPALLWRLRAPILGMGGLQVGLTTLVVAAIGLGLGLPWQQALAVGLILALSSTAIVLQTLNEKGLMPTQGGQSSFAVLLFQDIAVIPMLAVMPLLAVAPSISTATDAHASPVAHLPGWQQGLITVALIAAIIIGGRLLTRPIFRLIASTGQREIFTAFALFLVIGIALAMGAVGLSPALGTFLAGVVLAESEYRHELESDVEPFKGLLLGLFFISVGAAIDIPLIQQDFSLIAILVAILVCVKLVVLACIGRLFRLPASQGLLFTFALAQGGEFAFVLFSFAIGHDVLPAHVVDPLVAVVALSMALTPLLMIINEKLLQPRFATEEQQDRDPDPIDDGPTPVIIAGFGRFGNVVGRLLRANGVPTTVLDLDPDQISALRRFGLKVFYGDAQRLDLLHAAGAQSARLLILATDDPERTTELASKVRHHFPHLRILARSHSVEHSYDLMHEGVEDVYRETFDSALSMGVDALRHLGFRGYQALRAARIFKQHEDRVVRERFRSLDEDAEVYASQVRAHLTELNELIQQDDRDFNARVDHAWEPSPPTTRGD